MTGKATIIGLMVASLVLAVVASRIIIKALFDRKIKVLYLGALLFVISLCMMIIALYF